MQIYTESFTKHIYLLIRNKKSPHDVQQTGNNRNEAPNKTKKPDGLLTQLLTLYTIHRILIRSPPVLKGNGQQCYDGNNDKSHNKHPPVYRRLIGKVLEPAIDSIPGNRGCQHKAKKQNADVDFIEHHQNLHGG